MRNKSCKAIAMKQNRMQEFRIYLMTYNVLGISTYIVYLSLITYVYINRKLVKTTPLLVQMLLLPFLFYRSENRI